MNRLIWITLFWFVAAGRAEPFPPASPHGYLYFGSVKDSSREGKPLLLGGGGEYPIRNGFTAAADFSYLYLHQKGFVLLSVGSGRHFGPWEGVAPFVNAGYGLALHGPARNLFYFGGGVTRWFNQRVGARVEVRDSLASSCRCGTTHFLQFRIGLTIR